MHGRAGKHGLTVPSCSPRKIRLRRLLSHFLVSTFPFPDSRLDSLPICSTSTALPLSLFVVFQCCSSSAPLPSTPSSSLVLSGSPSVPLVFLSAPPVSLSTVPLLSLSPSLWGLSQPPTPLLSASPSVPLCRLVPLVSRYLVC